MVQFNKINTHLSYPARFESMKGWVGSLMDACKEEKANALWKGLAYEEQLVDDCDDWQIRSSKLFEVFPNRFHFDGKERRDSEENKTGADHLFLMMVCPSLVKEGHVDQIYSTSHELGDNYVMRRVFCANWMCDFDLKESSVNESTASLKTFYV